MHQLLEEAEQITYQLLEEAARFRQDALSGAEQLRAQAEREAASLLDEARATANRLRGEGERDRANLLDHARVEAHHVRARAETERAALVRAAEEHAQELAAEAQSDTAALLHGARAEAGRLRAEGQDERAALLDAAQAQAERLRAEGRDEAAAVVDAAHAQSERITQQANEEAATLLARSRAEADEVRAAMAMEAEAHAGTTGAVTASSTRTPITPMHSSEIGARQFPRRWRGLDPAPVQKWLALVESSQATLEDEVDRLQAAWDDAVDCLARLKMRLATLQIAPGDPTLHHELEHARGEWEQAARALAASVQGRGNRSTFESVLIRQAMLEAPIRSQLLGYSKAEVDRLLASSATHVARLENRASILAVENQQLRERVLAQASWRLSIPAGESSADRQTMRSLPGAPDPATVGPGDHGSPQH
ncbi:MAG TPA: hypothetical protein VGR26_00250 [Acidimicrobiales bacterium]|nr:hypothetical protein [Acidimicrobiales bacterium]